MPRLQSGVWKHFTTAIINGRETVMCNYCTKTYTKNATKMQMHLAKCKEYSVASQQSPGPDGCSAASIPVPSFPSYLPSANPAGPFLIDSVDQRSQAYADEFLARAVYATSSSLNLTDNIYWKRFFNVLRPAYCPPTTEALSSHLLECEYDRVQTQVQEAIGKADSLTIMVGGFSHLKDNGTLVYVVMTPVPLFYKCTKTKDKTNVSSFFVEELKGIINEVGPQKVFAVITDDCPKMESAWSQVEEAFPHIAVIGCTAYGIQRLFEDLVAQPSMKALCRKAEQVVRHVKECRVLEDTFNFWLNNKFEINASNRTTLALPNSCDWTGVLKMFSILLNGQSSLQEMASSPDLTIEASIRATLQDSVFWKGLVSSHNLLQLVWNSADHIKNEDAVLSGVVNAFTQLRCHIENSLPGSVLHSLEQKAVLASLDRCEEFCVKPIHAAAYMLDPRYVGQQSLTAEQINSAYYVISSLSHHLNLDEGKVLGSFARFSAKQGLWKGAGIWSSCRHVPAFTWWKGLCSSEPLSAVATAILQIPPSTGVCETLWSRLCNAKTEGSLTVDRLEKLVAVQTNLNRLEPNDFELTPLESEEEEKKVFFQSETR